MITNLETSLARTTVPKNFSHSPKSWFIFHTFHLPFIYFTVFIAFPLAEGEALGKCAPGLIKCNELLFFKSRNDEVAKRVESERDSSDLEESRKNREGNFPRARCFIITLFLKREEVIQAVFVFNCISFNLPGL